jgi:hypothetical protein
LCDLSKPNKPNQITVYLSLNFTSLQKTSTNKRDSLDVHVLLDAYYST